jgi:hypothetical protein
VVFSAVCACTDALNYILYKYPNSSRIYEAKIMKTNMRLGNDACYQQQITEDHKVKQSFAGCQRANAHFKHGRRRCRQIKTKGIEFTKLNRMRLLSFYFRTIVSTNQGIKIITFINRSYASAMSGNLPKRMPAWRTKKQRHRQLSPDELVHKRQN